MNASILDASAAAIRELPPAVGVDDITTLLHLAAALHQGKRTEEAARIYRKVLLLDPGHPDALHLLGVAEHENGNNEHAAELIKRSLAVAPDPQKWMNLGVVQQALANIPGAVVAYRQSLGMDPTWILSAANLIYVLDLHWLAKPDMLLAERRRFNNVFCQGLTAAVPPHTNKLDPERKLKIGYVSGDFKTHSASMATTPFMFAHDTSKFEVYFYSTNPDISDADEATNEYRRMALTRDGYIWCEADGLPDQNFAEAIREQGIDILIDLSGYTSHSRLLTFARKPAPVQITGWGYATGTGLDCMDYLVSDPVCLPPEMERYYHEKVVRVPSLLAYDVGSKVPPIGKLPLMNRGFLTFGYVGRPLKINETVLAAWAEIMRRVPDSQLVLKGDEYRQSAFREWVMDILVALGVDQRRVKMLVATQRYEHLETYNTIDIALDTWPISSGVTALDCALMGVPLVTLAGDLVPSRVASSVNCTLGITKPDTLNTTVEQYIEQAVAWSNDVPFLVECREGLRGRLQRSIIMDGKTYAMRWEKVLRDIWRAYCAERKGATS